MQKTVWFQILKLNVQMSSWIIKHIPGTIDIKKTKIYEEKMKHGHWPINMKPLKVSQVYSWVIINITIIQERNCFI